MTTKTTLNKKLVQTRNKSSNHEDANKIVDIANQQASAKENSNIVIDIATIAMVAKDTSTEDKS